MAVVDQSKPIALIVQGGGVAPPATNSKTDVATKAGQNAAAKSSRLNVAAATYYVALRPTTTQEQQAGMGQYNWIGNPQSFDSVISQGSLDPIKDYMESSAIKTAGGNAIAIYTYNQTYQLGSNGLTEADKNNIDTPPFIINKDNQGDFQIVPNFSIVRDYFEWWKDNPSPQNIIQYNTSTDKYNVILQADRVWNDQNQSYELVPEQQLNNFQYLDGSQAQAQATLETNLDPNQANIWKVESDQYWLQLQIPSNFNENAISLASTYLTGTKNSIDEADYFIDALRKSPVNIWTSFKQNFLFGQFMKISSEFKAAILLNMVPNLISQTIATGITDILNNNSATNPTYYFNSGTSPSIIVNSSTNSNNQVVNNSFNLTANEDYAIYDKAQLNTILSFPDNLTNFPTLKEVKKTLVGDTNSFTNDIAQVYNKFIGRGNFYKNVINSILNATIVDGVYGKPIKLNDDQLLALFGSPTGIQALFELNSDLLASLNKGFVSIPGTEYERPWSEFSSVYIQALKKNVGLIPLINKPANNQDDTNIVVAKTALNKRLGINVSSWMGFLSNGASKIENLDNIVTSSIQGGEYAVYGIGLGEFFVCIGIWVGILMQTFVFDRDIRRPKGEWTIGTHSKQSPKGNKWARYRDATAWWFAKNSLMSFTTILQVTVLMIAIGLLGWFQIGPPFGLVYVSVLFTALIWTAFIQAMWFLFRDEVVGKFVVILFLIVNITSGWGTFPPVMQFKTFEVLSYIAPFTYCIHNQGLIIYGVAVNGSNSLDNLQILKNCGIQLIYLSIGYLLSIYEGLNLQKITFFGSASAKKVGHAVSMLDGANNSLGLLNVSTNKKGQVITKVNWDALDWTYNQAIANTTNALYPSIKNFKGYSQKHDCNTYTLVE